jgi:uncharacterized protein (DUF1778 family)
MKLIHSKPRTRAINFRLSEDEFEELKRACAAEGSRSLSDFARRAVWRMIVQDIDAGLPGTARDRINRRLDKLQEQLTELAGMLRNREPDCMTKRAT